MPEQTAAERGMARWRDRRWVGG